MSIESISNRLREAREARGLSQTRAAELIGRERKMLGSYEDPLQNRLPRLDAAILLADLYRVDLNYFAGKEEPMVYHTCPDCGANLDPGERCDCWEEKRRFLGNERKAAEAAVKKGYPYLQWLSSSPIMVTGSESDVPLYPIDYPDTRPLCRFVSRCIPHGEGVDLREWLRKEDGE